MLKEHAKQTIANIKEEEKVEKKPRISSFVSKVLDNGTIIETIYRPDEAKTLFAVYKDEEVNYKSRLKINGVTYSPVSPTSDILKHNVVLLPDKALEYGTTADLINDIKTFIHKYLQVSPFFVEVASYYVPFTWLYDKFNELPYLRALGDYGSGKTRFLQTIGSICYKPMFVGGASSVSPIFRIISIFRGTLILDEADWKYSDTTQEIIKILNQGFSKGYPVLRSESNGKSFEIKDYDVFGPKIIATRKHWKDNALESRCLVERMEKRTRKDIPLNLTEDFWKEAKGLRNKLLMFRFNNYGRAIDLEPEIDQSVEPRLNQIIIPLLSIINDQEVKKKLRQLIKDYNKELLQDKHCSTDAGILEAIVFAQEDDTEPTIKAVTDCYNKDLADKERFSTRKVGHVVRKILRLKVDRGRDGFRILSSNKDRIEILKEQYGISLQDDSVNVVNDVNVFEGIGKEDDSLLKEEQKILNAPIDSAS